MPSRWLRWPIIVFWLTTTSWLFWRDLWPNWRPGEPPPFSIDPVEEVQKGDPVPTHWTVRRYSTGKSNVFRASTWGEYHGDDDTYSLHARLDAAKSFDNKSDFNVAKYFKVEALTSEYRVTRAGCLHSLEATVKTTLHLAGDKSALSTFLGPLLPKSTAPTGSVLMRVWGEVHDGQFFAHCSASSDVLAKPLQFDLPPTYVSYTGSVLLPLHPVNHIRGLRPGQSWRQPLVDPLRDAFAGLPGFSGGVRSLNARVLPQPEKLKIGDTEIDCLVVEYSDDENQSVARTLVEQNSERVQQQEANLEDGQWIMTRGPSGRSSWRHLER
jgi:hypothetical protein